MPFIHTCVQRLVLEDDVALALCNQRLLETLPSQPKPSGDFDK